MNHGKLGHHNFFKYAPGNILIYYALKKRHLTGEVQILFIFSTIFIKQNV